MKIACQEHLLPGSTFKQKVKSALEIGFEGIELNAGFDPKGGSTLEGRIGEIKDGIKGTDLGISSMCGGQPMTFVVADPAQRALAVEGYKRSLEIAGELGATGPILVPIFGPPQLSDLSPVKTARQLEEQLLVAICKELAPVAAKNKANVILEPLNRYETHFLNRLEQGVGICKRAGSPPGLKIMADFFHMNIEEPDIAQSIKKAGKYVCHVHLADSQRTEPGSGHIDFASGFKALKEAGYKGYMAFECGISGADKMATLKKSVAYLKAIRDSV
jgi:sugar phosphate isomerase/epimerase